jgi:6-pyruvoyltetrahydropterin/6-carboxytetrahydropterin synthase
MYWIKSEYAFDAAHFLKGYEGKCRNLHGHRWRVVAELKGEELSQAEQTKGMLLDFGDLKKLLKAKCDHLDHCLIYETGSLRDKTLEALREEDFRLVEVPFRPTAENLARYFYEEIAEAGFPVHRVEVYETPTNCAAYEE